MAETIEYWKAKAEKYRLIALGLAEIMVRQAKRRESGGALKEALKDLMDIE